MNDPEMSDNSHRVKALEHSIAKATSDLVRVNQMLSLTPTKLRFKNQKGAIEMAIRLVRAGIAKLQTRVK